MPDRPDVDAHREPAADTRATAPAGTGRFGSETFCILPWLHTFIDVNGDVKLCCIATSGLQPGPEAPPLSLQQQPLRDIWNSPEMKAVREKMMTGQQVEACSRCHKEDALGQVSYRQAYNQHWLDHHHEHEMWKARVEASVPSGYEVEPLPVYYDIRPGNLCTLKCRMCHSDYSNLIEADPVHSRWAYQSVRPETTRFSDGRQWYQAEETVVEELLENVEETRMFYLAGGEPLVNPFIRRLIDALIQRGAAGRITLEISTNATVLPPPLLDKLRQFAHVRMFLSIDGYGPQYEYIRYPGKWETVSKNMATVSRDPAFTCTVTTTVQNYNVMSLSEVYTFCEALDLPCNLNLVYNPLYLSVKTMPRQAKAIATERLRALLARAEQSPVSKRLPSVAANMANVISELESESEDIYRQTIQQFIAFTSELDGSREQSFKDICPELYALIVGDGFAWTAEDPRG